MNQDQYTMDYTLEGKIVTVRINFQGTPAKRNLWTRICSWFKKPPVFTLPEQKPPGKRELHSFTYKTK